MQRSMAAFGLFVWLSIWLKGVFATQHVRMKYGVPERPRGPLMPSDVRDLYEPPIVDNQELKPDGFKILEWDCNVDQPPLNTSEYSLSRKVLFRYAKEYLVPRRTMVLAPRHVGWMTSLAAYVCYERVHGVNERRSGVYLDRDMWNLVEKGILNTQCGDWQPGWARVRFRNIEDQTNTLVVGRAYITPKYWPCLIDGKKSPTAVSVYYEEEDYK